MQDTQTDSGRDPSARKGKPGPNGLSDSLPNAPRRKTAPPHPPPRGRAARSQSQGSGHQGKENHRRARLADTWKRDRPAPLRTDSATRRKDRTARPRQTDPRTARLGPRWEKGPLGRARSRQRTGPSCRHRQCSSGQRPDRTGGAAGARPRAPPTRPLAPAGAGLSAVSRARSYSNYPDKCARPSPRRPSTPETLGSDTGPRHSRSKARPATVPSSKGQGRRNQGARGGL